MPNNSTKILFFVTLISGIVITISSNSWLGAWMGLEINLLSFIPIMTTMNNIYTTEASLKYFLIQALASTVLLFIVIIKSLNNFCYPMITINMPLMNTFMMTPLLLKSGSAPFHWWFPSVMEGLSWSNCFILMTIQKISPLILISYLLQLNLFSTFVIISSIVVGAIGGFNQISIRKILTYSSINHLGWMMSAMLISQNMWTTYLLIYFILILVIILIISSAQASFINQILLLNNDNMIIKFLLFSSLLSLGGLPPFLGFFPKWMIIQSMLMNNSMFILLIMVMMSLLTLYYYLRICYTSFIILHSETSWNILARKSNNLLLLMIFTMMMSLMGLLVCNAFNMH